MQKTVPKNERQATDQEKILVKNIADKRSVSRVYEEFLKFVHKKTTQVLQMSKRSELTLH